MIFKNKYFRFGLKLIFGLLIFSFVGWKIYAVFQSNDYNESQIETVNEWFFGVAVIFLMTLNWSLEAVKWKLLMQFLKPISFKMAIQGVLAGIPTGLITPNRLGNFIGRTQLLEKEMRTKASLLTVLANLAQFVPSVFFGCLSLLLTTTNFRSTPQLFIFFGGILFISIGLLLYFNPKIVLGKSKRQLFSDTIKNAIFFIQKTSNFLKVKILGLSIIRYFVFVTQYVFLLWLFDQDFDFMLLFMNVSMVYLLMTIIPGLLFGKLFLREAAALLVLGMLGIPDLVILWTGFILWMVNIGLPSLVGTLILLRNK